MSAMDSLWLDELPQVLSKGYGALLDFAHEQQVSDVHLIPRPRQMDIHLRQNGTLYRTPSIDLIRGRAIVQTLKAASKMNIAESRQPQDARLEHNQLTCRLATHPGLHGEALVIRLLGRLQNAPLHTLGFSQTALHRMLALVQPEQGITLICGATGSGKTTTLHALLNTLSHQAGHVTTLEDPVEIINPQALQTDLSQLHQLSFAQGLRSLMRQDPDTILIGEIRDADTAFLALQAALTGHRVLASLHAPDAMGALCRMTGFGLSLPDLLTGLNGLVVQRLGKATPTTPRRPLTEIISTRLMPRSQVLSCTHLPQLHALLTADTLWRFEQDEQALQDHEILSN